MCGFEATKGGGCHPVSARQDWGKNKVDARVLSSPTYESPPVVILGGMPVEPSLIAHGMTDSRRAAAEAEAALTKHGGKAMRMVR